jgi:hypothetical protein
MGRFIKLTNILINKNDIYKICIQPNKYHIHICSKEFFGFHFLGIGYIISNSSEIEVCETKHSIDYKIVSDWISKNK